MKVLPVYTSETVYEKTTLPNGLRIVTATMPHTRSAAVQFYIGVGARHEDPRISGISHFVEHMVFKGTEQRPNPVQISEAIEGVGGNMNAATDHEHTNYRALVPYNYLGTAMEVMTDMLRGSRFVPEEIAREREVIIEEINSTYDSPGDIADMEFDRLLWGDHPLGRDVAGSKASLKRIGRDELRAHVEKYYRPDMMVISVAGNVAHESVVEEAARLWSNIAHSPNGRHDESVAPANPSGPRIKVYKKRTEQTNLIAGVPAFPYTHPLRYTQDVLDTLLGCGMSSRLFVEIRENKGLAYSVSSFVKTYHDTGAFGVHAAVDNDRMEAALEAIMGELVRVKDDLVPEAELRKVKEYIKGNTLLSLERSGYVAHWGGWQELMLGRIESMDEALEKIEEVTAQQLRDLANELFVVEKMRLVIVGPAPKSEEKLGLLLDERSKFRTK
jgi:predicted Zn-dependent peptidase